MQRLGDARDANDVDRSVDVDDHDAGGWLLVLLFSLFRRGTRRYRCPRCKKYVER